MKAFFFFLRTEVKGRETGAGGGGVGVKGVGIDQLANETHAIACDSNMEQVLLLQELCEASPVRQSFLTGSGTGLHKPTHVPNLVGSVAQVWGGVGRGGVVLPAHITLRNFPPNQERSQTKHSWTSFIKDKFLQNKNK